MLKKLCCFPIILLFACGCANKKTVKPILNDITFVANIEYDDTKYVCDAEISNNKLTLTVKEPELIKDFKLMIDENGIVYEYKEIEYKVEKTIPKCLSIQYLYDVLKFVNSENNVIYNGEICESNDKINDLKYKFTFSPAGLPIELNIEMPNIKVNFYNVTIKN